MHIVIILITYARTDYALRTIDGIIKHLKFDGGLSWYICDDASPGDHYQTITEHLKNNGQHICGEHSEKLGYGGGVNKAWRVASQTAPVTLWLEDDWELRDDFNITPYVELLNGRDGIGMIRLCHMPIGLTAETVGYDGLMYLQMQKDRQYTFSGNPHLKHDRHMLIYGDYPTGENPGNTEIAHDWQVRNTAGPFILWPLAIGDRFTFHHIGEIKSYG